MGRKVKYVDVRGTLFQRERIKNSKSDLEPWKFERSKKLGNISVTIGNFHKNDGGINLGDVESLSN